MNKELKNWISRAVVIILLIAGLFIYFSQTKNTLNNEIDISLFTNPALNAVTIINQNDTICIKKADYKWWANDSIEVSEKKIINSLKVFKSIVFQYPVTGQKKSDLLQSIYKKGIQIKAQLNKTGSNKVQLYTDSIGNHYIYDLITKQIWKVYIAGDIQSIHSLFSAELSYWESNQLFSYKPTEIKKIEIAWIHSNEILSIIPLSNNNYELSINNKTIINKIDNHKIKFYLYEYQNIELNQKAKTYAQRKGEIICTIRITDTQNHIKSVVLYQMLNQDNALNKQLMIAHLPISNTWGSISYLKMAPILQHADFFLKK
jgi:hypothetical protein